MGAQEFIVEAIGDSPKDAFRNAVDDALYYHGHGGYTGTIAEKDSFVVIARVPGETAHETAGRLLGNDDRRISDKWGPAGCVESGTTNDGRKRYLFFGWASS